jgi:hypothetical protein
MSGGHGAAAQCCCVLFPTAGFAYVVEDHGKFEKVVRRQRIAANTTKNYYAPHDINTCVCLWPMRRATPVNIRTYTCEFAVPSAYTSDSTPIDVKVKVEYGIGSYEQDIIHAYYHVPLQRAMDLICVTAEDTIRAYVAAHTYGEAHALRGNQQLVTTLVESMNNGLGVHGWRVRNAAIVEVAPPEVLQKPLEDRSTFEFEAKTPASHATATLSVDSTISI